MPLDLTRRDVLRGTAAVALTAVTGLPGRARAADDPRLAAFFEETWAEQMARSPEGQTYLRWPGAGNDRWDDVSDAVADESATLVRTRLEQLRTLAGSADLSPADRLNVRLYDYAARQALEDHRWRLHDYPLEHFYGRHLSFPAMLTDIQPIRNRADVDAWLARVRALPAAVDQTIAMAETRAALGAIPPKFSVLKSLGAILGTLEGEPFDGSGTDSSLLADIRKDIAALDLPPAEKDTLVASARTALAESFGPAYRRLADYVEALHGRADENDGVWKLPEGDAYYRACLKRHTTLDLSPDEVHETGLREVARIHRDMHAIMARTGFTGSLQDFFRFLRDDPRFYLPGTPEGHEAYLAEARRVLTAVEAALDGQFGIKPKARVTVQRFDPYLEGSRAIAQYGPGTPDGSRPGIYYVNFSNMKEMPLYQLEVLAFHEAIPGHHLQISIAQELTDVPAFRRFASPTAYVEGWGLYSERLPKELGFYKDPYADFGRLSFELWRAIRLVVDTGIHARRWTREQATDYFVTNSSFARETAAREVDRYIAIPGQACAYMIGMLKILDLREKARTALGGRFDIRAFHDTVLRNGAVPLAILEEIVDDWIAATKA
ncbi:DUF885 domain-containing protein [Rhodocista pekingensis]|uniref:DUF885 domain-containing protein n=1 Tax=Rhodocista pekingensis TaxID=201185 RepID=A0ABW2KRN8_9PROT